MIRFWKESSNKVDKTMPSRDSAKMVETTSYALLTALLRGDQAYANPIVQWLSEQQRYGGGFYSTQVLAPRKAAFYILGGLLVRIGPVLFGFTF